MKVESSLKFHGIDQLNTNQSFANNLFSFFDAFTVICPLTIHNDEIVLLFFSVFTFPADRIPCWTYDHKTSIP